MSWQASGSQLPLARVLVIAAAVTGAALLAMGGRPIQTAGSITLLFGILAFAVVVKERRRWGSTMGTVSPLSIYAVAWLFFFGVFALGAFDPDFQVGRVPVEPDEVVSAMWLALGSLLLIAVGYHIALAGIRSRPARYVGDISQPINSMAAVLVFLAIGWGARLLRFESDRFGFSSAIEEAPTGYLNRALVLADGFLLVGLAILAIAAWSRHADPSIGRRRALILLLANIFPLLVITGLASGVKGQLITDLMPVGLMYLMLKGRPPLRFILLALVYLLVLYSGIQQFRADFGTLSLEERSGLRQRATAVLSRVADSWSNDPPQQHIEDFYKGVTEEYASSPGNLAVVLDQTPQPIRPLGVSRLITAPLFFLPTRFLGEATNIGGYFAQTYLHIPPPTSVFPTQMGDFYMSGGMAALILGEIAVGLLLGLVWRAFTRGMTNRAAVLYVMIAAQFANAGVDWGTLVRTTLQFVVFYGLVLKFVLRQPRGSPASKVESRKPLAQISGG